MSQAAEFDLYYGLLTFLWNSVEFDKTTNDWFSLLQQNLLIESFRAHCSAVTVLSVSGLISSELRLINEICLLTNNDLIL